MLCSLVFPFISKKPKSTKQEEIKQQKVSLLLSVLFHKAVRIERLIASVHGCTKDKFRLSVSPLMFQTMTACKWGNLDWMHFNRSRGRCRREKISTYDPDSCKNLQRTSRDSCSLCFKTHSCCCLQTKCLLDQDHPLELSPSASCCFSAAVPANRMISVQTALLCVPPALEQAAKHNQTTGITHIYRQILTLFISWGKIQASAINKKQQLPWLSWLLLDQSGQC